MAEREVLITEVEAFRCEREQDDALLGVTLFNKTRVRSRVVAREVDEIQKPKVSLTLTEAGGLRRGQEEAYSRYLPGSIQPVQCGMNLSPHPARIF